MSLGLDEAEALTVDGGAQSITISNTARRKLEYVRSEMGDISKAATFDELLLGLTEFIEDHPETDIEVPDEIKSVNGREDDG